MYSRNEESIEQYNKNIEKNTGVFDKIKKSLALGIAGLSMTGSLYANDINVQQDHLRNITGNQTIELNSDYVIKTSSRALSAEEEFKSEINQQFENWYDNEKDSPNFTTIDKMKYLMGKSIVQDDYSIEETEQMLQNYKLLFNNLKQVITQVEINEFHKNLSEEKKDSILSNSDVVTDKIIALDVNHKSLNKDDKVNLMNLQNLAKVVDSNNDQILDENDKILMTSLLAKGYDMLENKINDYDKQINSTDSQLLAELEEEDNKIPMDILR